MSNILTLTIHLYLFPNRFAFPTVSGADPDPPWCLRQHGGGRPQPGHLQGGGGWAGSAESHHPAPRHPGPQQRAQCHAGCAWSRALHLSLVEEAAAAVDVIHIACLWDEDARDTEIFMWQVHMCCSCTSSGLARSVIVCAFCPLVCWMCWHVAQCELLALCWAEQRGIKTCHLGAEDPAVLILLGEGRIVYCCSVIKLPDIRQVTCYSLAYYRNSHVNNCPWQLVVCFVITFLNLMLATSIGF